MTSKQRQPTILPAMCALLCSPVSSTGQQLRRGHQEGHRMWYASAMSMVRTRLKSRNGSPRFRSAAGANTTGCTVTGAVWSSNCTSKSGRCVFCPPQCHTPSWRKALRPSSPLNPVGVSNGVGNQRLTNASTRTPLGISRKERSAPAPGRRRCAPADCGPR